MKKNTKKILHYFSRYCNIIVKEVNNMYRIIVNTTGKYGNFSRGARYAFTKKAANKFIAECLECECEITVERFIHCAEGIFAWSDDHALYGGLHYDDYIE